MSDKNKIWGEKDKPTNRDEAENKLLYLCPLLGLLLIERQLLLDRTFQIVVRPAVAPVVLQKIHPSVQPVSTWCANEMLVKLRPFFKSVLRLIYRQERMYAVLQTDERGVKTIILTVLKMKVDVAALRQGPAPSSLSGRVTGFLPLLQSFT